MNNSPKSKRFWRSRWRLASRNLRISRNIKMKCKRNMKSSRRKLLKALLHLSNKQAIRRILATSGKPKASISRADNQGLQHGSRSWRRQACSVEGSSIARWRLRMFQLQEEATSSQSTLWRFKSTSKLRRRTIRTSSISSSMTEWDYEAKTSQKSWTGSRNLTELWTNSSETKVKRSTWTSSFPETIKTNSQRLLKTLKT